MKTFLISDNIDTVVGLNIAGIRGIVVSSKEQCAEEIRKLLDNKEIELILITEKAALLVPDLIEKIKLEMKFPLITEIPDASGSIKEENDILQYIKRAIGLNLQG